MLHSQLGRITLAIEMIKMQVPPGWSPEVGVILGSGLGALADEVQVVASLAYASVPGFVKSSVVIESNAESWKQMISQRAGAKKWNGGRLHFLSGASAPLEDSIKRSMTFSTVTPSASAR